MRITAFWVGAVLVLSCVVSGGVFEPVVGRTPGDRIRAVDAIARQGPAAADKWSTLVASLEDPDLSVRVHVVRALGKVKSLDSAPALEQITRSKGEPAGLREAARAALKDIGPVPPVRRNWFTHAHEYVVVHGELMKVPPIDPGFGNSRHLTVSQARREMDRRNLRSLDGSSLSRDAAAVKEYMEILPEPKIGEYGLLLGGNVTQVLGAEDALIQIGIYTRSQVTDERPAFIRFSDSSTEGLTDGSPWPGGVRIAVIGSTTYADVTGGSRTVPQAVPMTIIRAGISFRDYERLVR